MEEKPEHSYIQIEGQDVPTGFFEYNLSGSFLVDFAQIVLLLFLTGISYLIIRCLYKKYSDNAFLCYLVKYFLWNAGCGLFLLTFQEVFMIMILQFNTANFDTVFNISSFIFSCMCAIFLSLMVGFYIFKGFHTITFNEEDKYIKFRTLFDRIPHSIHPFNKIYYLLYFAGKISVVFAVVF